MFQAKQHTPEFGVRLFGNSCSIHSVVLTYLTCVTNRWTDRQFNSAVCVEHHAVKAYSIVKEINKSVKYWTVALTLSECSTADLCDIPLAFCRCMSRAEQCTVRA